MKTIIYYYTATGNSLAIARDIARGLGDARLVPAATHRAGPFKPDADRIGIVFPVYAWGPPRTVEEFLSNIDPSELSYVFAVASSGGTPGGSLPRVRKALRAKGGDLDAGFAVTSPAYFAASSGGEAGMIRMVHRLSGPAPKAEEERLEQIIEAVKLRKRSIPERGALAGSVVGNLLHGVASGALATADKDYRAGAACDKCGICARVCPRGNIAIGSEGPAWQHDCDSCGTCATWCPKAAITRVNGPAPSRGCREGIELRDMLLR